MKNFIFKGMYLISMTASFVFAGYGLVNNSFLELQIFLTGFGIIAINRLFFDRLMKSMRQVYDRTNDTE